MRKTLRDPLWAVRDLVTFTAPDIAERVGISERAARYRAGLLVENGLAVRVDGKAGRSGGGSKPCLYVPTEDGRMALAQMEAEARGETLIQKAKRALARLLLPG
mgnify:CR=1 FL=1